MMFVRLFSFALVLLPWATAFRAPDNLPRDLQLPTIQGQPEAKVTPSPQPPTMQDPLPKPHHAAARKRWGMDNTNECDYWHNPTIHTLGNIGFLGALHAALAPLSTKLIDILAYEGRDVRRLVADELSVKVKSSKARVVDLCCGVGISTRALRDAFPEAETVVGIDTSSEMISMATFLSNHLSIVRPSFSRSGDRARGKACPTPTLFSQANAENTQLPSRSFDLVTIMYAFHEAPKQGREKILKEAHRLLQPGGTLAVIDICTDYKPSKSMLAGEPYVLEYQKNIHKQLRSFHGFARVTYKTIVPNHVGMW
eukprot:CAMPEP_0176191890 /NCGR_PEP_ID=MMETSP0121_2-20121125/4690_1 /TAXON_ID=160619 /ORGANISM="Kryptoperidinium foliaceum, Strain CCMP 1326" /LENGTH=310 /DNA_ID=CAMNT_0017530563 /DNA_START=203 /DNA_END=1132 /DNA_ORIENTATION=-